jgi:hypothetical protein
VTPVGVVPINVTLWTYVSNRDLRVLYFDGVSAELNDTGVLDSQEVLLARQGGAWVGQGPWDDYARLRALCAWAKDKNVDGFVRMNTAFELAYCDFERGIDLVSKINITVPNTPPWELPPLEPTCNNTSLRSLVAYQRAAQPNLMGLDKPPQRLPEIEPAPLASADWFEWLRAAVHRHHHPQPNVRLISSGMVTFYDPALTSLVPVWSGKPMAFHRVWNNISRADANTFVDQVEDILRRPDLWTKHDDIAWSSIADQVVEAWSDRLAQINYTLHNPARNTSSAFRHVQLLAYTLLNPYIDTTSLPHINGSDPALWLPPALGRCIGAYTPFIEDGLLTSTERLLKSSIETVLSRLCHYAGDILAASFENTAKDDLITSWKEATVALMAWLDWATWVRCQPECGPEVSWLRKPCSEAMLTSVPRLSVHSPPGRSSTRCSGITASFLSVSRLKSSRNRSKCKSYVTSTSKPEYRGSILPNHTHLRALRLHKQPLQHDEPLLCTAPGSAHSFGSHPAQHAP